MIADDVILGEGVRITHPDLVNLYGCEIGDGTRVGPFVEIQRGVTVGRNCKISSHSFICTGVAIEDEVFVGHGVMFVNDKHPKATNEHGEMTTEDEWDLLTTRVEEGASIGSNATILGGVTLGPGSTVGAGAVVIHDVPENHTVVGNPARSVETLVADRIEGCEC